MKKTLLLVFAAIIGSKAFADVTLPNNVEVKLPQVLSENLVKESDLQKLMNSGNYGQSQTRNKYWIVYSDRDENVTYTTPGGGTEYKKLSFNQPLRIAKISGEYALVYSEPVRNVTFPTISADGQKLSFGWVPMKHLLLWSSCPTNEKMIYNKALIMMNLDQKQNMNELALCLKNPQKKNIGIQLQTDMKFYFVMKQEGDYSLLATAHKMSGQSVTDQVLYGWVKKAHYIPWDQRSCLEPNWNQQAGTDFNKRGVKAEVHGTPQLNSLRCTLPLGEKNGIAGTTESNEYRLKPEIMRFPLLESMDKYKDYFHCMGFGGNGVVDVTKTGGGQIIIDGHLEQKSHINIIVVIDGTNSMEGFYKPMQEAIQKASTFFDTQKRKVRVGVVIYRDYPDGECVTEYLPMKAPGDPALKNFLETGGKYGVSSKGKTWTEALYKGLEVALDTKKMGYSAEQSNIMFVVGDCGNDINDKKCLTADEIVDKMVKNHIQLASFQVRNVNQQAFLLFRKQMSDIVLRNMRKQYSGFSNMKSGFAEIPNGNEFRAQLEKNYFMGSNHYASLDKEMPAANLEKLVTDRYERFGEMVDIWTGEIWNAGSTLGGSGNGGAMNREFLKSIFTDEEIKIIENNASLMAVSGYAKKTDGKYDMWKPVLYISSDEFAKLRETLNKVRIEARKGSNTNRQPFIEAIKQIAKTQTSGDYTEWSVDDIMNAIAGVNVSTKGATGGYTILELQDEKKVKQAEFDKLVNEMLDVIDHLESIAEGDYKFKTKLNNNTYYWLPAEDIIPSAKDAVQD